MFVTVCSEKDLAGIVKKIKVIFIEILKKKLLET